MSDPLEPQAKSGAGRGIKIALALSLAVNLLIVGLVAGAVLGFKGPDGVRGPGLRDFGLGPFALALPREDRAAIMERIDRAEIGQQRRQIGGALRELQQALRSTPFDRSAVEAALARSREVAGALQAQGHGALVDQLETMTPEARRDLADRLSRALRRIRDRRGE